MTAALTLGPTPGLTPGLALGLTPARIGSASRATCLQALFVGVLLIMLGACTPAADRNLEQVSAETVELVTTVKTALIAAPDVDAAAIRVSDRDGVVVLDGFVGSEQEREAAVAAARSASQATVTDELQVR